MPSSQSILKFLGLGREDFDLLARYRPALAQRVRRFAPVFYDYLSHHADTAAILDQQSPSGLASLLERQMDHFERLLRDRFDRRYQQDVMRIGGMHYQQGIAQAWLVGGYALYLEHLEGMGDDLDIPAGEWSRLRQVLARAIFADISLQLEGFVKAQSEDDAARTALTRVLIHTMLTEQSNGAWEVLLDKTCRGLVGEGTRIVAAWSAVEWGSDGDWAIRGAQEPFGALCPLCILPDADDPCSRASNSGMPVILTAAAAAALGWLKPLPLEAREVGFFPFGKLRNGYAGVGIFASDSANYFRRIGFDPFQAFSHFAELLAGLREQSLRDPLTGLPNRALFSDRMHHAISGPERRDRLLAIGVLDLDGFKAVNDRHGHAAGDKVLRQVAARLRGILRPQDTLARLGGDEFGLLLDAMENVAQLDSLVERLVTAMRLPFDLDHDRHALSVSIGFTLFPLDDAEADVLLRHADMAMYSSKNAGGDRSTLYSTTLSEEAKWAARLSRELRHALTQGELTLYYQPQVDMPSGAVVGMEALLRWQHPTRGVLAPGAFLSALEDGQTSRQVGRFVLQEALTQQVAWAALGLPLRVCVNIGTRHLLAHDFIRDLDEALKHCGGAPDRLEIEVTETTAIADLEAAREILAAAREMGVTVALDDFGTGNAPLSYLQRLPADAIKIDRSFVSDILHDPKDAAIVAGVITSARLIGLAVIGEGVESIEHGCLLLQLGCQRAQGYAIAMPMPGNQVLGWVSAYRASPVWSTWTDQPWRPEDYGLMIVALAHAQRMQEEACRPEAHAGDEAGFLAELNAQHLCVLGRWLHGDGSRRYQGNAHFQAIAGLHEQLHEAARDMAGVIGKPAGDGRNALLARKRAELQGVGEAIQKEFRAWLAAQGEGRVR